MIVLVDPDDTRRSDVAAAAPDGADVRSVRSTDDLDDLIRGLGRPPSVVVVGPRANGDGPATAIELASRYRATGVVLLANAVDADLLRRGMRAGLTDVLAVDAPPGELRDAVEGALAHAREQTPATPPATAVAEQPGGQVITVFSTKGGSGKSLVAVNLAVVLAQRNPGEVALVDLDLQSGDVAILLQLLPAWTIEDASRSVDRLDEEALRGYLTAHRSGVQILAAPLDPAMSEVVTSEAIHQIVGILRGMFRFVVIDGPAFFTDQILAALDESDNCILVGSLDVPSIKNLKLALQTLSALGMPRNQIHVALNRADSHVGLNVPEVEKSLGTSIDVAIPSSREVPLSVNQGSPIAVSRPKSAVTKSLEQLAELVAGGTMSATQTEDGRRFRLFGRD